MKNSIFWAAVAAFALIGAPACGSKSKEPKTTPTTTDRRPETTTGPSTDDGGDKTETPREPTALELSGPIYFEFDSSDLNEEARQRLAQNLEWLQKNPTTTLTIEGHTDEAGTTEYNLGLGERRARAARDYLVRLGADAKRLKVLSFGEERPAQAGNDTANRRDEFKP